MAVLDSCCKLNAPGGRGVGWLWHRLQCLHQVVGHVLPAQLVFARGQHGAGFVSVQGQDGLLVGLG